VKNMREIVIRWFERIPPVERDEPLIIDEVTGRAYSPREVLREVLRGTSLGERLQRKIERGFLGNLMTRELAKKRVLRMLRGLPPEVQLATFSGKTYSREELIYLVQREIGVGRMLIETEMERMRELLSR